MTVIDFTENFTAEKAVREVAKGAESPRELEARFAKCTILPEPGRLYDVQIDNGGYTLLFLIGKGQRPRVVEFIHPDFKWREL